MARTFTRGGWGIAVVVVGIFGGILWFATRIGNPADEAPQPTLAPLLVIQAEALPPSATGHYEIWLQRRDGGEERVGAFRALAGGSLVTLAGDPLAEVPLADVPLSGTVLLITLESGDTPAERRSARVVLHGVFQETAADLADAFPVVAGKHQALLGTPTRGDAKGAAGLWFAAAVSPEETTPGLQLPPAPDGWTYGAWVVTGAEETLLVGTFRDSAGADSVSLYSDTKQGWAVPGEDFVRHAPDGIRFPLNLADGRTRILVSLEPAFGNEERPEKPFLVLFGGRIPYRQKAGASFLISGVSGGDRPQGSVLVKPSE